MGETSILVGVTALLSSNNFYLLRHRGEDLTVPRRGWLRADVVRTLSVIKITRMEQHGGKI